MIRARLILAAVVIAVFAISAGVATAAQPSPDSNHLGRVPKGQTPTQTINAQTNPAQAAQALNSGCADLSNCSWQDDGTITFGWGPPQVLGDVLYNCSPTTEAETSTGVTDTRQETTSLTQTLSLKVSLGFAGFADASTQFQVSTGEEQQQSTSVTTSTAIFVPPLGWGYTSTIVQSATVPGDAYITSGINKLIKVTGIDLSFPGYEDPSQPVTTPVGYGLNKGYMTPAQVTAQCGGLSAGLGATQHALSPKPVKLTVCTPRGRCAPRTFMGSRPLYARRGRVTLSSQGRTRATGTVRNGRIRLTAPHPLRAGRYTLRTVEHLTPSRSVHRNTVQRTTVHLKLG
jgi:hypothetical protein